MDNIESNKRLIETYPFLAIKRTYDPKTETYHTPHDYDYSSTWLDYMPIGWKKAFGEQLCKELKKTLDENGFTNKYLVAQVKEKFGGLRWYDYGVPDGCHVHDIIRKYSDISYHTCCECGKPATKTTKGWVLPYCDSCYNEYHSKKENYE